MSPLSLLREELLVVQVFLYCPTRCYSDEIDGASCTGKKLFQPFISEGFFPPAIADVLMPLQGSR